jgi:hypothetical protein
MAGRWWVGLTRRRCGPPFGPKPPCAALYSRSPAASRASPGSRYPLTRTTRWPRTVHTLGSRWSMTTPLSRPRPVARMKATTLSPTSMSSSISKSTCSKASNHVTHASRTSSNPRRLPQSPQSPEASSHSMSGSYSLRNACQSRRRCASTTARTTLAFSCDIARAVSRSLGLQDWLCGLGSGRDQRRGGIEPSDDVTAVNGFRDCAVQTANPVVERNGTVKGKQ